MKNDELLKSNLETTIINETQNVFDAIDKRSNYFKLLCKDVKNDTKNSAQINRFIFEVQNNLKNYKTTIVSNNIDSVLLIMSKLSEIIEN